MFEALPIFWREDLLYYAFLTVLIEVPLFWIFGYRSLKAVLVFALANICSNLLLNEFLLMQENYYEFYVVCGEVTVVGFEYVFCRCLLAIDNSKRLFLTILATNVLSFLIGVLAFW